MALFECTILFKFARVYLRPALSLTTPICALSLNKHPSSLSSMVWCVFLFFLYMMYNVLSAIPRGPGKSPRNCQKVSKHRGFLIQNFYCPNFVIHMRRKMVNIQNMTFNLWIVISEEEKNWLDKYEILWKKLSSFKTALISLSMRNLCYMIMYQ